MQQVLEGLVREKDQAQRFAQQLGDLVGQLAAKLIGGDGTGYVTLSKKDLALFEDKGIQIETLKSGATKLTIKHREAQDG